MLNYMITLDKCDTPFYIVFFHLILFYVSEKSDYSLDTSLLLVEI